jgi:RNA polymerase sigma factor (sigma-70 family)
MKCRYCGNELRSGERFCRKCGKPAEAEPVQSLRFCIECGAELLPNAGFCRSCGAPVSQQKPEQPQQPNAAQTDEKAELKRRTEILVIAAQGGDSESFAKLYELYHQKVFALAKTTVKSDADAEDVLQMTFIKAWDHLDRLKDTSAFSTWIQRITLNQCYSLLRKQHATIPIDNDDEDSEPIQIESDLMLPEVYAEQNDLKKRLGKIIDELSDVQKQTITLYYFDGLPVENIAWIMDCSVNTVKSRLFLARKSIKTEIEEQERKSGQPFYGIVGLATIPFGQFFVAHVKASSLSQTAASALLKAIAGKISQSASAAVKAGTSAAAKGAANAGAKTAAAAGTKAAAGAGAKTAAAVGASVSKKVIAGIVAGTLAVSTVAGGTVATVKIVQNSRERKAAESATTVVTDGTFPSVTASDPFLPQDPSGGLSAQEREAYQAYLEHLEQNKPGIDGYKNVFDYSDDDSTDPENYPMPRAVALFDVCGDAIPELIYINEGRKDAQFGTIYNLNVLTYRDGSLVSVYRDEWDFNSYWDEMITYYLFADPTSKTMYFFEDSSMSNYVLKEYSAFTETESGHLQRSKIMFHEEEYDEDSEKTTVVYNVNGKNVSEADFRKEVERLQANAVYLIPRPGEFREPENAQYIAMTCDEMIAYLQGLLNASTGTTEQPAATSYADAYAAYIDYLIAHKEGIDRYIWQLDDWYYFYQEDEITGGLTPWQSDTWRYYYGEDGPQAITTPQTPRPVVFYNIYGDAIPELIFIEVTDPDISYSTESTLNILTYQNGQLVSLYSGKWDCPDTDEWRMELTLSVRQDGTLYRYEENGSTFDGEDQYDVYTVNTDGRFTRELALRFTLHEEDEEFPPPPTKEYYGRSNQIISETEYEELKKAFDHSTRLFGWSGNGELAMTADEAIAWLQSQLGMTAEAPVTPSPTAEPTPSDVGATSKPQNAAPDTVRNAYQAYIEVLEKNRKFIQLYEEYPDVFDNTLDKTPDHTQRAVAFHDLNNDGIPELIYIRDQGSDENDIELNVLSFQHEEIITVYTNNVLAGDAGNYFYFTLKDDPTIYVNFKDDAEYTDLTGTYSDLYSNEYYIMDNSWKDAEEKPFLSDSEEYVASKGGFAHVYRENDKEIDRAAFEAKERALLDRMDCCLILGWMASQTMECNAMTCDEAIAWLKNRLAETAAPTVKPADEVSTENPDHTADDASRVRLTDLESISTTPRETTAKLTDNYETVYEYAVINNHGYNGSAGPLCYEFLTNAKYRLFTGTIYVPNGETSDGFSSLTVKGDGFTLYTSPAMSKTSKPVPFEVNVAGFNDIVIEWSNNSGYSNISNLNCCIGDAYFIVDPDGSEQPDRLHLPISLTDLNSIYSAVRRNTRLLDNFGNKYNKAIYNRIDNLHGNTIPVLEYLLNAQYSRFCCTLYIPEGSSFRSAVVMHVLADDVEIYVSPEMTATSGPVEVDIDLSGCTDLKITFSAGSWYNSGYDATLCLADPYLYLAGDR